MPIFVKTSVRADVLEELDAPRHLIYKVPTADLEDGPAPAS